MITHCILIKLEIFLYRMLLYAEQLVLVVALTVAAALQILFGLPEDGSGFCQLMTDGLLPLPFPPVGLVQPLCGCPQRRLRRVQMRQGRVMLTHQALKLTLTWT